MTPNKGTLLTDKADVSEIKKLHIIALFPDFTDKEQLNIMAKKCPFYKDYIDGKYQKSFYSRLISSFSANNINAEIDSAPISESSLEKEMSNNEFTLTILPIGIADNYYCDPKLHDLHVKLYKKSINKFVWGYDYYDLDIYSPYADAYNYAPDVIALSSINSLKEYGFIKLKTPEAVNADGKKMKIDLIQFVRQ